MKKTIVLIFTILLATSNTIAQHSLWVGESYTCDVSSAILGSVYNMSWSSSGGYFKISGTGFYRTVTISQYFSGTASITCSWDYTLYYGGSKSHNSKTWTFTCNDNPASITPTSLSLSVGQSADVSCSLRYNNSYTGSADVYFQSTDPTVASVDSRTGHVVAISAGTAYINAYSKVSGNSPSCSIVVSGQGQDTGGSSGIDNNVISTTINNINYDLNTLDSTASVTGIASTVTSLTIPSAVMYNGKNYTVTEIAVGAFEYRTALQSITLPNTLIHIGHHAFWYCSSLTSLTIPSSVQTIDYCAIYGCSSLTYMYIPNNVLSLGHSNFSYCTNLTSVTIGDGISYIPDGTFSRCESLRYVSIGANVKIIRPGVFSSLANLSSITWHARNFIDPASASESPFYKIRDQITSFDIGDKVEHVPSYLCYSMTNLPSVTVGRNVSSFGTDVFRFCNKLSNIIWNAQECESFTSESQTPLYMVRDRVTSITFGKRVKSIPAYLCYKMGNLQSLQVPDSVMHIGRNAFTYCTSLESISVDSTNTWFDSRNNCNALIETSTNTLIQGCSNSFIPKGIQHISNRAFYQCSFSSISIPNSVISIDGYAFQNCSSLTEIILPNSIVSIGGNAFAACASLSLVVIPNNLVDMGEQVFVGCSSLPIINNIRYADSYLVEAVDKTSMTYTIQDGTKWIDKEAFANCSSMTNIDIPNSVISIGSGAFKDCSALTSIAIPDAVSSINNSTFERCSSLQNITLGSYVKSIGLFAFAQCSDLQAISLPESVTQIGNYAFNSCSNFSTFTIPDSITNIGRGAFSACSSLEKVYCNASLPPIVGENIFSNCSNLDAIYVPCEQLEIYQASEGWNIYDSLMQYAPTSFQVIGRNNISEAGEVVVPQSICDDSLIIAVPNYGYHFTQWSDGNTDNPRIIELTQDTSFTAEFATNKSGTCGKNNALIWSYDNQSKTLSITGNGELTENYTYGVEAPTQMNTLIIGNGITAIGDSAFYGLNTIYHLFIGANVASIGNNAFAECRHFDDITCYATIVPAINATTFANVGNKLYIYLFVPENSERAYQRDEFWSEFDIRIKGTETTTSETNSVTIEPSDNTALFTWPINDNAVSYSLKIMKDGEVFCTLVFNGNGQLTGISFAPSRNGSANADAATMSVSAMSFTVTGLNSASKYAYRLSVTDESQKELIAYSGEFATTGYEGEVNPGGEPEINTEGYENILSTEKASKLLRNGQIYILRGNHTYTLTGQRIE